MAGLTWGEGTPQRHGGHLGGKLRVATALQVLSAEGCDRAARKVGLQQHSSSSPTTLCIGRRGRTRTLHPLPCTPTVRAPLSTAAWRAVAQAARRASEFVVASATNVRPARPAQGAYLRVFGQPPAEGAQVAARIISAPAAATTLVAATAAATAASATMWGPSAPPGGSSSGTVRPPHCRAPRPRCGGGTVM